MHPYKPTCSHAYTPTCMPAYRTAAKPMCGLKRSNPVAPAQAMRGVKHLNIEHKGLGFSEPMRGPLAPFSVKQGRPLYT